MDRAKRDPGLSYCLYLLTRIARATASHGDFSAGLEEAGLVPPRRSFGLPDAPLRLGSESGTGYSVVGLAGGFASAVDRHLRRTRGRTDLGELAQLAATESFCALCVSGSETLFGATEATVRQSLRRYSSGAGFARLAHDFFARLIRRYLEYHLSRELSNHVGGPRRRFANADEHNEFLRQLDRHCRTATSVLRPFARDWYGLHRFRDDLTQEKAAGFAAHALDRVRDALRYQEGLRDAN